ncbi:DUF3658 domain-containing protein [Lentilactobacillus sp. Marseille-Q4993]|uniref:DUF3658 domain-containing protein n=1 Tax=Lentilactobacillus sp. Marseille-Q4993 TaxID=3039492 RepID=UPI0024BCE936|nr:DUF3658 domain-containing protein [Lentilactobacillus sp. Marseille-Q4993]
MIDITFEDSFYATLKHYYTNRRVDNEVISLPLSLDLGNVIDSDIVANRKQLYIQRLAGAHESHMATVDEYIDDIATKLTHLDELIARGRRIRLWVSEGNVADYCALRWFSSKLLGTDARVSIIQVPSFSSHDDRVIEYAKIGELGVDEIDKEGLFSLDKMVSQREINGLAMQWRALSDEPGEVRVLLNGQLLSRPADFYDQFILESIERTSRNGFVNAVRVIGETLGNYLPSVPDWWLRMRITHLIETGKLESKDDGMLTMKIKLK